MTNDDQYAAQRLLLSKLQDLTWRSRREDIAIVRAPDVLDDIQEASDRELALAAIERDGAIANQIRLALRRLETGEYGMCLRCSQSIGSRRLHAVPWASMCVTCQGHMEAERQTARSNGLAAGSRERRRGVTV
jgi:RNA polymerase-binding protein DksA